VPCNLSIAFRYVMPEYQSDDYPKLETFLQKTAVKAREGDPRAQTLYGLLIAGLPQFKMSRVDALPWFTQAAQAGMPLAQFTLGYSMLQGWGCTKEVEKGLFWLRKAAAVGQADAQVAIALHLAEGAATPEKSAETFTLLEQAAAARNRDGRYYLAALLATSADEKRRDPERAVALIGEIMRDVDSDPAAFEIRAAAKAGQGNFAEAVKDQRKALQMAQKLGWNVQPQQLRLESYLRQRPWTGNLFAL
jgi:TPR repeat protein